MDHRGTILTVSRDTVHHGSHWSALANTSSLFVIFGEHQVMAQRIATRVLMSPLSHKDFPVSPPSPRSGPLCFRAPESPKVTKTQEVVARVPYRYTVGLMIKPDEVSEQLWYGRGGDARGPIRHLFMTVDRELYRQMGEMAQAVGCSIAAWLRYWLRQVTVADFPAHWQAAADTSAGSRSHDSCIYDTRFMLRLDAASDTTLRHLAEQFHVPRAEIIRQLLAQATPETFPAGWHLRVAERYGAYARRVRRDVDDEE